MACQVFLVATLLMVAIIDMAMASEAPSHTPKTAPTPSLSPKALSSSPKASVAPKSEKSSPLAPTPAKEEEPSSPLAPASEAIEFGAPAPSPVDDDMAIEEPAPAHPNKNGASTLKMSAAVSIVTTFFAF